jgi:hypothetical protein
MCFKQYRWRHLLKIAKLAKIDVTKNYTEAKVWGNYQKKLETYFIEYLVKYFATILSFCC